MERTANVYPCVAFVDDVHDVLKLHVAHKWNVMSHETHQHVRLVTLVLEEACPRLQFHVVAQVTVHELQGLIDCHHDGVDISIGIRTGIHLVHPPEIIHRVQRQATHIRGVGRAAHYRQGLR